MLQHRRLKTISLRTANSISIYKIFLMLLSYFGMEKINPEKNVLILFLRGDRSLDVNEYSAVSVPSLGKQNRLEVGFAWAIQELVMEGLF